MVLCCFCNPRLCSSHNAVLEDYYLRRGRLIEKLGYLSERLEVMKSTVSTNIAHTAETVPNYEASSEEIQQWLKKVDEHLDYERVNWDNRKLRKMQLLTLCFLPCTAYSSGFYRSINQATREAEELVERGVKVIKQSRYVDMSTEQHMSTEHSRLLTQNMTNRCFIDRSNELAGLRTLLMAGNQHIIGIVGMGGIGKTALMKELYGEIIRGRDDVGHSSSSATPFDFAIWVHVGPQHDIFVVQSQIARLLDLKFQDDTDQDERRFSVYGALASKRSVLFLDDVWDVVDFERIGIREPSKGTYGCKIVLTSRNLSAAQEMDAATVTLDVLSDDRSWELFRLRVKEYPVDEPDTDIHESTMAVVRKCCGVPLAIVLIARQLDLQPHISEFMRAVSLSLKDPFLGPWINIYQLVLYGLDEEEKSCLQYCSLIPRIDVKRIVNYLVGEQVQENISEGRKRAIAIIRKLQSLFYFRDTSSGYDQQDEVLVMSDLIRWASRSLNRGSNAILTHTMITGLECWKEAKRIRVLSHSGSEYDRQGDGDAPQQMNKVWKFPNEPLSPSLHSLVISDNPDIKELPRNFFIYMPLLQVLDLSGIDIRVLPPSIKSLHELRYLNLSNTPIQELPQELGFLVKLRQLYLQDTKRLQDIHPDAFYGLSGVQILNASGSSYSWVDSAIENLKLCYALNELGITIRDARSLRTLLQSKLCDVTSYLEFTVQDIELLKEAMSKLTSVKELYVSYTKIQALDVQPNIADDVSLHRHELQILEKLKLGNCSFASISYTPDTFSEFLLPNLYHLEVNSCHRLLDITWVQFIPSLKHLTISNCLQVEIMLRRCGGDPVQQSETLGEPLAALKSLRLMDLPKMKRICDGFLSLNSMVYLTVSQCPMLKTLPLRHGSGQKIEEIYCEADWWNGLEWEDPALGVTFLSRLAHQGSSS